MQVINKTTPLWEGVLLPTPFLFWGGMDHSMPHYTLRIRFVLVPMLFILYQAWDHNKGRSRVHNPVIEITPHFFLSSIMTKTNLSSHHNHVNPKNQKNLHKISLWLNSSDRHFLTPLTTKKAIPYIRMALTVHHHETKISISKSKHKCLFQHFEHLILEIILGFRYSYLGFLSII